MQTFSRLQRPTRFWRTALGAVVLCWLAACAAPDGKQMGTLSPVRIAEIVASPDRSEADCTNDLRRKPEPMLAFIGIRPGMVALDLSTGAGYTAELLARAVGPTGRAYGQSRPPPGAHAPPPRVGAGPEGNSAPQLAQAKPATPPVRKSSVQAIDDRAKEHALPQLFSVARPFEDPVPEELVQQLDLVTLMFNYHDLTYSGVDRVRMNAAVFAALKPGGMYVIADHAGRPGTGMSETSTLHRFEEDFLVREVESAGFKLIAHGDFLRNPNDPRDKNTPEPAQPKDEFVLKFGKP
ncbi:MAG: class I SAM-dependent methyltransferase [Rhodoferax sp.]|nr:class I SAM-dependent methyltransferase [Rhodoferax sp.]